MAIAARNAYVFPRGNGDFSMHAAPLVDCTSMIHNTDNIHSSYYQGRPYNVMMKVPPYPVFRESFKHTPPLKAVTKHTNDPYAAKSADGSPLLPKLSYSVEESFRMSYQEESNGKLHSAEVPQPRVVSTVQHGGLRGACALPRQPAGAHAAFTHYQAAPVPTGHLTQPAEQNSLQANGTKRRVEQNQLRMMTRSSVSSQVVARASITTTDSSGNTSVTSVTHVRCKRAYVNGRPVTVWLNEDQKEKHAQ